MTTDIRQINTFISPSREWYKAAEKIEDCRTTITGMVSNPPSVKICMVPCPPETCDCGLYGKNVSDRSNEVWLIHFADAEVRPEIFVGENAEEAARYRFKECLFNWNCYLFKMIEGKVDA